MGYTILISGMILGVWITAAAAQTFGGDKCTVDCSGHKAGYEWAESKGITAREQCVDILKIAPKRTSFYEGCLAYVEDPIRGAEEDDEGDEIHDERKSR